MDDEKTTFDRMYEYSENPFTPFGKMKRGWYFLYCIILTIPLYIDDFMLEDQKSLYILIIYLIILIMYVIFDTFILKKRILDINNNEKKSWVYAIFLNIISFILGMVNQYLCLILIPFYLYILFAPSYENKKIIKNTTSEA